MSFKPPLWLRNGHVQTVVGSRGRGPWAERRAAALAQATQRELIECQDAKLEVWLNTIPQRPTVIIIHGWLGCADSSYVLSAAAALHAAGFGVARLNLRDHGDTAHLNAELFHSARIGEVVEAIVTLRERLGTPIGLLGFSLGGNFALRVAKATGIHTLAVCPAMDPAASTLAIDHGLPIYRWFFVRKWRTALAAKQAAFPDQYDFGEAQGLSHVSTLTGLFVRKHTPFADMHDYFAHYTLTGDTLAGTVGAEIVYAQDDPVIPAAGFADLPADLRVHAMPCGGHCSFITNPTQPSWVDHFAVARFADLLG